MTKNNLHITIPLALVLLSSMLLSSCKTAPFNPFKPASPHELYERKLVSSGLAETGMGETWINLSESILTKPVAITIPYSEKGYFPSEKIEAVALSFTMQRGQKLAIKLDRKPLQGFTIFTDVWSKEETGELRILGSADSLGQIFEKEIDETGTFILRLQPELLSGGEYTLEISSGPSLEYPLQTYQRNQIQSFWGDGRDAGSRKHEGIDIFSAFRTPVLAIAPGVVTRVNETNLGGKVVWLRPEGKDYSLYYAHLDEQLVTDGQRVALGDTLGLMGKTGNARTTPPHLHFGIYGRGGAVDPLPFVNPQVREPAKISSAIANLNSTMRTNSSIRFPATESSESISVSTGTIVRVKSATGNSYRIETPDKREVIVPAKNLSSSTSPLRSVKVQSDNQFLFDRPDSAAAVKITLKAGETVKVLGNFQDFNLVENTSSEIGWLRK